MPKNTIVFFHATCQMCLLTVYHLSHLHTHIISFTTFFFVMVCRAAMQCSRPNLVKHVSIVSVKYTPKLYRNAFSFTS